jgi:hypothetical protein
MNQDENLTRVTKPAEQPHPIQIAAREPKAPIARRSFVITFFSVAAITVISQLLGWPNQVMDWLIKLRTIRESKAQPTVSIVQVKPDYIEGTEVTHAQLKKLFPFGYVVYSFKEGKETYDPRPGDRMKFKFDLDAVKITPDFSSKTVLWELPPHGVRRANQTSEI